MTRSRRSLVASLSVVALRLPTVAHAASFMATATLDMLQLRVQVSTREASVTGSTVTLSPSGYGCTSVFGPGLLSDGISAFGTRRDLEAKRVVFC